MRYFLDFWVQVYLVSLSSFPGSSMMQVPAFHFLWLNKHFMAGVWSVDGHLGCSHFLAVGNTVGNIHTQASLSFCFFFCFCFTSLPPSSSFLPFLLSLLLSLYRRHKKYICTECTVVLYDFDLHFPPLQYSCPENSMDSGAWQATVHGVAESDTTKHLSTHTWNG